MRFATLVSTLALALGVSASPFAVDRRDDPEHKPEYQYAARLDVWNGRCGSADGHTRGYYQIEEKLSRVCQPLHEDTHGLYIHELDKGCRVSVWKHQTCDDYPDQPTTSNVTGCLWMGGNSIKSYMVTCPTADGWLP